MKIASKQEGNYNLGAPGANKFVITRENQQAYATNQPQALVPSSSSLHLSLITTST